MAPTGRADASGSGGAPRNKAAKLQAARTVPDASKLSRTAVQAETPTGVKAILKTIKSLPGGLSVEAFTEARSREIVTLKSWMANTAGASTTRAFQSLPRHLRRRAASHNPRRVPRRIRDKAAAEIDANDTIAKKQKKRAAKRLRGRNGLKVTDIFRKRQRDKTWLETHIWHAKRFHLVNLWRYRLALSSTLKSHRPAHRAVHRTATIHDASYYGTIELEGQREDLIAVLKTMTGGEGGWAGSKFESGGRMAQGTLYHSRAWPCRMIAPFELLWKPQSGEPSSSTTQPHSTIWLRLHPAAFEEAWTAIKASVSAHVLDNTTVKEIVSMRDLRGEINAFEIMGPNAARVLRGVLTLCQRIKGAKREFWDELLSLETAGSVPQGLIAALKVYDPRLSFPPANVHKEPRNTSDSISWPSPFKTEPSPELAKGDLWDQEVRDGLFKPRYRKADLDARRAKLELPGVKLRPIAQDDRIPITLIQRSVEASEPSAASASVHGFTLLVPAGWAMPFWQSLVFTGSFVIGLKERATQYHETGLPSLPEDFGGVTFAGDKWAAKKRVELQTRWDRRPPGKRAEWTSLGTRSPFIADWDEVLRSASDDGMEVDQAASQPTWLVRQPILKHLGDLATADDAASHLLDLINGFRTKRAMNALSSGQALLPSAIVQVRLDMPGKGSPDDLALIYRVSADKRSEWLAAEATRQEGRGETVSQGFEEPIMTGIEKLGTEKAEPSDIIGYVTSGNFSLARGAGHGIGVVSLKGYLRMLHLGQQSTESTGVVVVKVRNRDAPTYRLAKLSLVF